jgi:hypothetical protein
MSPVVSTPHFDDKIRGSLTSKPSCGRTVQSAPIAAAWSAFARWVAAPAGKLDPEEAEAALEKLERHSKGSPKRDE